MTDYLLEKSNTSLQYDCYPSGKCFKMILRILFFVFLIFSLRDIVSKQNKVSNTLLVSIKDMDENTIVRPFNMRTGIDQTSFSSLELGLKMCFASNIETKV